MYHPGDHVLVLFPRPDKLAEAWQGPFQIITKENKVTYIVENINSHEQQRMHVNRLHMFYPGTLTADQLAAEAAKQGEYYVEAVHAHKLINGTLWFFVKWLGYEQGDINDQDAWVRYADCRFSPTIKEYIKAHHLKGR